MARILQFQNNEVDDVTLVITVIEVTVLAIF